MLDPKLVEEKIGELEKAANKADKSQLEDSMQTETVEKPSAAQTFDLFDELADDFDKNSAVKNLRITHIKTAEDLSSKKVACMDRIIARMQKNYDIEAQVQEANSDEVVVETQPKTTSDSTDVNIDDEIKEVLDNILEKII